MGAAVLFHARWLDVAIGLMVLAGLWIGRRQAVLLRVGLLLALAHPAWKLAHRPPQREIPSKPAKAETPPPPQPGHDDDAVIRTIVTAEETQLALAPQMEMLSETLLDLRLPGTSPTARSVFADSVQVTDLAPAPKTPPATNLTLVVRPWPVAKPSVQAAGMDLWRALLDGVSFFDHAKLSIVQGTHPDGDMWRFEATARFDGLAKMKSGEWRSLRARLGLGWQRSKDPDGNAGPWRIARWTTEEMVWMASPRKLFVEALDAAIRPPQDPRTLRRSQHYEAALDFYRGGMKRMPHPYFAPISANQKEGLAVADVNQDGFDDIYITVRLGKNLLLVNHGDGTFSEAAAQYRLDLPGHTTCALFADFDNDGDQDAILGRSLLRTSYLENRGGWFYQYPIPKFMPMAVISMSAADYNSDGLLDVYLCTYRPAPPSGSGAGGGYATAAKADDFDWPDEFFSVEQAREFRRRLVEHQQRHGVNVLDQLGPPNVLLVNRGAGRFEIAPESATVGLWRNSLQATWNDYNRDGRPDLYIANDWGPATLFRNDGPAGFKNVTAELGLTFSGFSMGVSWGDFDNDGRDDLYVSNMYSEAGRRITREIPELNPMFKRAAAGNFLYHQQADGTFKQIAGERAPAMTVMNAGWSWGGCFADFDNNGFLDLYVLSGYYTAPEELASGLDLDSNLWRTTVRADNHLSRPSFRFSPEWKRTPPPDRLGPEIDARMAGIERRGDRILVHSLQGKERNHYFANRDGRAFVDLSALSGCDNPADSRGFALIDYDRDGWCDLALVNANLPLFNLYHNEAPAAGLSGGMIALRFVGGNRTPAPSEQYTCRDGYGARVTVELGDRQIVREHRCGEGWSTQNSSCMIVGIGAHSKAVSVSVKWPSGKAATTHAVEEGTLLTAYENPADSPTKEGFVREPYRRTNPSKLPVPSRQTKVFPLHAWDVRAKPAHLRAYIAFATSNPAWTTGLPRLRQVQSAVALEGIDIVAAPVDPADDIPRLAAYAQQWKPPARLVNIAPASRGQVATAFADALGHEAPIPSTVITDGAGHILTARPGLPSVSLLRKWLPPAR